MLARPTPRITLFHILVCIALVGYMCHQLAQILPKCIALISPGSILYHPDLPLWCQAAHAFGITVTLWMTTLLIFVVSCSCCLPLLLRIQNRTADSADSELASE